MKRIVRELPESCLTRLLHRATAMNFEERRKVVSDSFRNIRFMAVPENSLPKR